MGDVLIFHTHWRSKVWYGRRKTIRSQHKPASVLALVATTHYHYKVNPTDKNTTSRKKDVSLKNLPNMIPLILPDTQIGKKGSWWISMKRLKYGTWSLRTYRNRCNVTHIVELWKNKAADYKRTMTALFAHHDKYKDATVPVAVNSYPTIKRDGKA